jgi:hypothetical protein
MLQPPTLDEFQEERPRLMSGVCHSTTRPLFHRSMQRQGLDLLNPSLTRQIPWRPAGGCAITNDSSTGFVNGLGVRLARGWADKVRCRTAGKLPVLHEDRQHHASIVTASPFLMSVMGTDHRTRIPPGGPEAISTASRLQRNPVIWQLWHDYGSHRTI